MKYYDLKSNRIGVRNNVLAVDAQFVSFDNILHEIKGILISQEREKNSANDIE